MQFLQSLEEHQVRYMLVGGAATVFHGHVRTTQDLDLWVQDTPENRKRLIKVFEDLQVPDLIGYIWKFGKSDFNDCYKRAKKGEFKGVPITVIDKADLIKEKEALARPKDLDDVENLKK